MDSTLTCYNNGIETEESLPNTHLDHLEDLIFTGRGQLLNALREIYSGVRLSVKWDGAPAIVFGTDPRNGKFFVGTKSVFNKSKSKSATTRKTSTNIIRGMLRTSFVYVCVICLASLALSKLIGSGSVAAVFTALILWSIAFPLKLVVILSLLHILTMTKFLRMLWGGVALVFLLHLALSS